jgi:hypothetical protein
MKTTSEMTATGGYPAGEAISAMEKWIRQAIACPILKLWFWLTTHVDCAWCQRRRHRAWIPLPHRRFANSVSVPRISHGICPECVEKMSQGFRV